MKKKTWAEELETIIALRRALPLVIVAAFVAGLVVAQLFS